MMGHCNQYILSIAIVGLLVVVVIRSRGREFCVAGYDGIHFNVLVGTHP
jgi:hypothetical protein